MTTLQELIDSANLGRILRILLILEFEKLNDIDFNKSVSITNLNNYLWDAVNKSVLSVVNFLLNQIPQELAINYPNSAGWTMLHVAAQYGHEPHITIAQLLCENKANVNAIGEDLMTPLHYASSSGSQDLVKTLLEYGANVDALNTQSDTPLNLACAYGYTMSIFLLVEYGANVKISNTNGHTPLQCIVKHGDVDCTKLLLDKGADIDATDVNGLTPLLVALSNRQLNVVRVLLWDSPIPANLYTKTKAGETLLEYANNHPNIPKEIKDLLNLQNALIKCLAIIPTPWYRDAGNNHNLPVYYALPMDMMIKIAIIQLQSLIKIDNNAENLILDLYKKLNRCVVNGLIQNMAEATFKGKNLNGNSEIKLSETSHDKKINILFQKLNTYSKSICFFSNNQRQAFVEEISGKELSDETIHDTIDNIEDNRNIEMKHYFSQISFL